MPCSSIGYTSGWSANKFSKFFYKICWISGPSSNVAICGFAVPFLFANLNLPQILLINLCSKWLVNLVLDKFYETTFGAVLRLFSSAFLYSISNWCHCICGLRNLSWALSSLQTNLQTCDLRINNKKFLWFAISGLAHLINLRICNCGMNLYLTFIWLHFPTNAAKIIFRGHHDFFKLACIVLTSHCHFWLITLDMAKTKQKLCKFFFQGKIFQSWSK